MKSFVLAVLSIWLLSACGGGGVSSSNSASASTSASVTTPKPSLVPGQISGDVQINGVVTFDRINLSDAAILQYDEPQLSPARGITVELWDSSDTVLRRAQTDESGHYALGAPPQTSVRVVALAQMQKIGTPGWDFDVLDNSEDFALYTLAGDLKATADTDEQRDLHAASGWSTGLGRFADESVRPAAPFAILDTAYEIANLLLQADAEIVLPTCHYNWSYQNIASPNDSPESGEIGTTYYDLDGNNIYVLGSAYNDTDEYDASVLIHETAHFLEDVLSRSDSFGGDHALGDRLDMRVAFSEGYANALAGIVAQDSVYKDSFGPLDQGLRFDLENYDTFYQGWFNENSIGKVLYDLVDTDNEPGDDISLPYSAIHNVVTDAGFVQSDVFSSIFLFREIFDLQQGYAERQAFARLLADESILGIDRFGSEEVNSGYIRSALPVYRFVSPGGSTEVCSTRAALEYNGLGVAGLVYFSVTQERQVTINLTRSSHSLMLTTDPDAMLYQYGELVSGGVMLGEDKNRESRTLELGPGEYVLEVFEASNVDNDEYTGGSACFLVSID